MAPSTNTCKNCSKPVIGKYCSDCGQSTGTGRINYHYIINEFQHSFLHVDRGIFYTIKELLLRPGDTMREYLSGKRISHFKPFAFVIILGTIYGFMGHFFKVYPEDSLMPFNNSSPDANEYSLMTYEWIYSHYSVVMLAFIPFFALGSYLVFRKSSYNYVEFLVICSYISGMQILFMIAIYFLYYFIQSAWIVRLSIIIIYLYHIWAYVQLFDKASKFITMVKTWVSMTISFLLLLVMIVIISLAFVLFLHH